MQNAHISPAIAAGSAGGEARLVECGEFTSPDLDSHREALSALWDSDDRQLSAGPLNGCTRFASSMSTVVYEQYFEASVQIGGAIGPGVVAFAVPRKSAMSGRWWGADFPAHALPFARNGETLDMVFRKHHCHTIVVVREHVFRTLYEQITGRCPDFIDREGNYLAVHADRLEALRMYLSSVLSNASPADGVSRGQSAGRFDSDIIHAVVSACEENPGVGRSSRRGNWIVEQAIDRWRQSGSSLSVLGLCRGMKISRRTLENAFRQCVGVSPAAYFKILRLNACRRLLLDGDPAVATVTESALCCGFTELGRFAGEYRRFFGESPSTTLKDRSRRACVSLAFSGPPATKDSGAAAAIHRAG